MGDQTTFSRRRFFGGVGSGAGALAAIGSSGILGATATAAQAASARQFSNVGLALEIDGAIAGILVDARGGGPAFQITSQPLGEFAQPSNIAGPVMENPVTIVFTSGMSAGAFDWFGARDGKLRDVTIVMYDTGTLLDIYRLSLVDTLVTQFALPRLDASRSGPVEFSVTLQPTQSSHQVTGGKTKVTVPVGNKAKALDINGFRFFIDKLEQVAPLTSSLEGIAVKRNSMLTATGRSSSRVATTFEFPSFEATMALPSAGPLYQWFGDMLARRNASRAGQLQLLGPNLQPLATIDFTALQPLVVSTPYDGGNETRPAVKVLLSPSDIRLNLKSLAA